jgi:hypothetical protein
LKPQYLVKQLGAVECSQGGVEVAILHDLARVGGKAIDVGAEIGNGMLVIGCELGEIELGSVVKSLPSDSIENRIELFRFLGLLMQRLE